MIDWENFDLKLENQIFHRHMVLQNHKDNYGSSFKIKKASIVRPNFFKNPYC